MVCGSQRRDDRQGLVVLGGSHIAVKDFVYNSTQRTHGLSHVSCSIHTPRGSFQQARSELSTAHPALNISASALVLRGRIEHGCHMGFPPKGRGRRAGGSRHRVRRGLLSVRVPVSQPPASDRGVMSDTRRAKAKLINDTVLEGRSLEKILRGGREVRDCDVPAVMTYRRKIPTRSGTRIHTRGNALRSGRASRPFRAAPGQIPPGSHKHAGLKGQMFLLLHRLWRHCRTATVSVRGRVLDPNRTTGDVGTSLKLLRGINEVRCSSWLKADRRGSRVTTKGIVVVLRHGHSDARKNAKKEGYRFSYSAQ